MISKPTFTAIAGSYKCEWSHDGKWIASIVINRLREDSKQIVSGEVTIEVIEDGTIIKGIRFALTSQQARNTIVKKLETLYETIEWAEVIDLACSLTLDAFRQGEPVVKIKDIPPREGNRWRLYPILLENECHTIYGAGGEGKSKLCAGYFALLVQLNIAELGLLPTAGNVLVLDWETCEEEYTELFNAFKRGLGITVDESPYYRYCSQPLVNEAEEIQRQIADKDISLIIIDSMVAALGEEPESAKAASVYYNALRSFKRTSLTIDHKPWDANKIFGSVFKYNRSRSVFELRGTQQAGSDELDIALYHRKINNGKKIKPLGFKLKFFENENEVTEKITVAELNVRGVPELTEGLYTADRIVELLHNGTMFTKDIAQVLGKPQHTINTVLYQNKERFVKVGKGQWGLLSPELEL